MLNEAAISTSSASPAADIGKVGRENSRKMARIVGIDFPNRYKLLKFYGTDRVAVSVSDAWPVV
jgi:hypothetical protein